MNSVAVTLENMGATMSFLAITILCCLVVLCFLITICVFQIRNQAYETNKSLKKIMDVLQIRLEKKGEKAEKRKDKKGLQLDDNDIEKLKNIGVGME